jgi:hypothetical protein
MIAAMASWTEGRGYTLILTHPRGPDRYARVALVHKRTLFGLAFNVREARAEDAERSGREPGALGLGRMLSWRWLGEREADELLAARLRTLETLGYTVLGADTIKRGIGCATSSTASCTAPSVSQAGPRTPARSRRRPSTTRSRLPATSATRSRGSGSSRTR